MMGAGGAARAALIALEGKTGSVTITDRDTRALEDLLGVARSLGTTPIGKNRFDRPVWGDGTLADDAIVYDFVYAGHVTATIARARELGAGCIDGWDPLREQAAAMIPVLGLDQRTGSLLKDTVSLLERAAHSGNAALMRSATSRHRPDMIEKALKPGTPAPAGHCIQGGTQGSWRSSRPTL